MRCAAWAILIAILCVGCNQTDANNLKRDVGDLAATSKHALGNAQLVARINTVLIQRKGVDMSGLHIEAENGVVTVSGHVRTPEEKQTVGDTIEQVRGVVQVVNNLVVAQSSENTTH